MDDATESAPEEDRAAVCAPRAGADMGAKRRFDPHPPTTLFIGSGDDRETIKATHNIVLRPPDLINTPSGIELIEPSAAHPVPSRTKGVRRLEPRLPDMKKYKDTVAHGTRPKLIRQCRSFPAPALVVAAQFPKE